MEYTHRGAYNKLFKRGNRMLPSEKDDKVYNALCVGMSLEDAYIYAGATPEEIRLDKADEHNQGRWQQAKGELEFGLLTDMRRVASKQIHQGRSEALQWQLEKFFPRYSAKPQPSTGTINIIVNKEKTDDITEVFDPSKEKG